MRLRTIALFLATFCSGAGGMTALAQRTYTAHSVLSTGAWYKIAITSPGIYALTPSLLNELGINISGISSQNIRLYGNGGAMLPEAANGPKSDDLVENPLLMLDGGDGTFDAADLALFYAPGPGQWIPDSINHRFTRVNNLYSDTAWYYITIGGTGLRISDAPQPGFSNISINSFDARYAHELDSVNFLSSGKSWVGEELSNQPGHSLTRNFGLRLSGIAGRPGLLNVLCLARSIGAGSRFYIAVDQNPETQVDIPPVTSGPYDQFVRSAQASLPFTAAGDSITVRFRFEPGNFSGQGWIDVFTVQARAALSLPPGGQLPFRDWNSVGAGNTGAFTLSGAPAGLRVWDITNPLEPLSISLQQNGSDAGFVNSCQSLHEYIAFAPGSYLKPLARGKVANQDLHGAAPADLLIVCHPSLLAPAGRLAAYHRQHDNLRVTVATTNQVYNEFSSGTPDPAAIRDYVKMFYDRAGMDSASRPRYLLLFGDASFDYKDRLRNNTSLVPAFESAESYDPLSTYTSDDFFGFLDDADDINSGGAPLLDIGVGRIPAATEAEANGIVDKILAYHQPENFGPWHNELSFVADDEDANLHLQDAEAVTASVSATAPVFHIDKTYLDAYPQQSASAGARYPEVNLAISNQFYNGTLIWNYNGHGGYRRLAEEVILDQDIINQMKNAGKLPLFITATCDFAPYDNPLNASIGENLLLRPNTGAIALMTTTRLVFAFSNRVMNKNYLDIALRRKPDGNYPSLGDAVKAAKNYTYTFSGDIINNRKFTLLGDPALTLAYPRQQAVVTAINGVPLGSVPDTLKALSEYLVEGEMQDAAGNRLTDFDGLVYPEVFHKPGTQSTLGNDPGSIPVPFQVQNQLLFRGKAHVSQGKFSFRFIVPRDIRYAYGPGRVNLYANSNSTDGNGFLGNIIVGGTGTGVQDDKGPEIKAWLNDRKFVNGSITNDQPLLLLDLSDSSGINILGTGIGHDLVAILDDDPSQTFVLNAYYEAAVDDFRRGTVSYQLPALSEGNHRLTIKAWDVANNSNDAVLDFQVQPGSGLTLRHILNYPNPFTTHTEFWFEHNRPGESLSVMVQVFTVSGKLVKTIRSTIISGGNRSNEVIWDGRDDFGSRLARGVYIYRLRVQTTDGQTAEGWEKCYIL